MIITVVLAMIFTWCLFYGQIPQQLLIFICIALGVLLSFFCWHDSDQSQFLPIDALAHRSRLKNINSALKFWTVLILMLISVASKSAAAGIFLMAAMFVLVVFVGGLSLRHYLHILALPVSFLLIGGLALLFEVSSRPAGVLNINLFGWWFSVLPTAQVHTTLVVSRAFGAVSCLCFLSVTTPMSDIISVLHRARCPDLIIDLMYLIFRYIFIVLSLYHDMYDAAKSRLGFRDYRTGLRTTGRIYTNLLARSYQFASKSYDAMESRCYSVGIRFLERRSGIAPVHIIVSTALLLISLGLSLF